MKQTIRSRIATYELFLLHRPTPLLKCQLDHAISLHKEALDQSDIRPFILDLDGLQGQIEERWEKVFGQANSFSQLVKDMYLFQQFLAESLLSDYAQQPFTANEWVDEQAKSANAQTSENKADDYSDKKYQNRIAYPLDELMVDRVHVESKLSAAITKKNAHSGLC